MKISKYFIVLGLLGGSLSAIGLASHKQKEVVVTQAETTKDLSTIISVGDRNYLYSSIGNFFFNLDLSEQIFTNTGYFNDHLTDGKFADENSQNIDIGNGLIINGQTFNYWREFAPSPLSYPRNSGVTSFPLYAENQYNPVAVQVYANKLEFKMNLDYMPMDSIVITFKAGLFKGYNANTGTKYTLSEDLTFYSTLNETPTSSNPGKVTFVKARNEVFINGKVSVEDKGESTNSQGGKYHQYNVSSNIPRDKDYVPNTFPATHFRYVYDNYLLNDMSFTKINSWARGNSKDFTDLNDISTITAEYETIKPGGEISVNECLALTIQYSGSQPNYVAYVFVPNQLVTDLSLGSLSFSLRDGSAWYTKDENGNAIIGRINNTYFANLIASKKQELQNYVDLSLYNDEQQADILSIIDDASSQLENALTEIGINNVVAQAKADIDLVQNAEELLEQAHIDAVVALIDAIVTPIEYTEECSTSINAAMEAYATLTASEIAKFPAAKLNALYDAYAAFAVYDLANYKHLSKAEIDASFNNADYRELQQSAIADILANANAAIDDATTKAAVQEAVDSFYASLALIPTDKQLAKQELAEAKAGAIAELDAIDLSVYRETERAQVQEIISKGKVAISYCESVSDVETLLNKIKSVIASIETDEQLTSAEAANAARVAKQKETITTIGIIAGSLVLAATVGLTIIFIRKRKTN